MKFENTQVYNFEGAIKGMRNPLKSWERSDSYWKSPVEYNVGPEDLKLMRRLIKAGNEHRKFLRQIVISVDMTMPLYVWKEFDQYKVGITTNSESTMHTIEKQPITLECFETDDFDEELYIETSDNNHTHTDIFAGQLITKLEQLRLMYLKTADKRYWKELIRWLPESWLQTRTVSMSYENLWNIYQQRKHHKLTEWHTWCKWAESLPYFKEMFLEE